MREILGVPDAIFRISVIPLRSCGMTLEERSRSVAYGDSIRSSQFSLIGRRMSEGDLCPLGTETDQLGV